MRRKVNKRRLSPCTKQPRKFSVFDSPFLHQTIGVLNHFLVDIFVLLLALGLGYYFEAGLCKFLNKYFVDKLQDVLGGSL